MPGFLGDEFDGPAGSAPNPALWSIAQRRELIKNPVFWDRPENMGQYRDDREHVFLDGNSNLVIRATREAPGKYVSGKVVGNFAAPIGHTFEARVKFECLTPDPGPLWWLLNDDNKKRGARSTSWSGTGTWSGRPARRFTPASTAPRSRRSRFPSTISGTAGA